MCNELVIALEKLMMQLNTYKKRIIFHFNSFSSCRYGASYQNRVSVKINTLSLKTENLTAT